VPKLLVTYNMVVQVERPWNWVAKTLLRVQRNGLKIDNQWNIGIGAFDRAWCEASKGQSPKSKPLAMNSHGLSTWMAIVWSLQSPSPKSKPKGAFNFIPCPNIPSNLTTKILSMIDFLMNKTWRPLNHSLGFHSRPTQTSIERPSPSSKSKHFKLQRPLDFSLSVKGREAELVIEETFGYNHLRS